MALSSPVLDGHQSKSYCHVVNLQSMALACAMESWSAPGGVEGDLCFFLQSDQQWAQTVLVTYPLQLSTIWQAWQVEVIQPPTRPRPSIHLYFS